MDWIQKQKCEKKNILKTTIDILKNSSNSLCKNYNPSTSYFINFGSNFNKKLINELNDNNNNQKFDYNNNNDINCFDEISLFGIN